MPSAAIQSAVVHPLATQPKNPPRPFSLVRGLRRILITLFVVNLLLDMLIYHGIASTSTRKPGEVLGWFATPYSTVMAVDYGHLVQNTSAAIARWYPKDLGISKGGTSRTCQSAGDATKKFFKGFVKP